MKIKVLIFISIICTVLSCKKDKKIDVTTEDYHASIQNVSQIMLHDIFSPPVASRIYVYPTIAAYEVMAQNSKSYNSLQNQIGHLDSIPKLDPKLGVNQKVAAMVAHMEVSKALVFSENAVEKFKSRLTIRCFNRLCDSYPVAIMAFLATILGPRFVVRITDPLAQVNLVTLVRSKTFAPLDTAFLSKP